MTATRPLPSAFLSRSWATTPRKLAASIVRTCDCWSAGNASIMRSTVLRELFVCSVPKTSKPVSAAVSARRDRFQVAHLADEHDVRILAQRRLQPGRETRRVLGHLALGDDALFVLCTNSIGSSTVTMCRVKFVLM